MTKQITVTVNGAPMSANENTLISEILNMEKPCGGRAKCGKCTVYAFGMLSEPSEDEKRLLSESELRAGIRLACKTYALGDCDIVTNADSRCERVVTDSKMPRIKIAPRFSHCGAAIDIGTTTLAARLYSAEGKILAETGGINPQGRWGADVVSRIEAALGGNARELSIAIRGSINEILRDLARLAGISCRDIDGAVITGNSVMLSLLTGEDVECLSHAPFNIGRRFGEELTAEELELFELEPNTGIYLPPCISAFVGADIICAILSSELTEHECAMLADIGTNGEIALINHGKLSVCSTAAGPAFEGVGILHGMRAAQGAIDRANAKDGKLDVHVIGECEPIGICGSGLIDAVAALAELGIIDESGYLEDGEVPIAGAITLTQKDIRMLQLAKSAICAGILTLADVEKISSVSIQKLFVAGGFGNYLNLENAARIGLLPKDLAAKALSIGNAALAGASMLLLNRELAAAAENISTSARTVELHANPTFTEHYTMGMLFEEVDG